MDLLDEETAVKQAVEPTDIIWENRHVKRSERLVRWIISTVIMVSLTFCSFLLIIWLLKRYLLVEYTKNPPGISCDIVLKNFEGSLQQFAFREGLEWRDIDPLEYDLNRLTSRNGALKCFCDKQAEAGLPSEKLYEVIASNGAKKLYPICEKYSNDTSSSSFVGVVAQAINLILVVLSKILEAIFSKLIKMTKENR